LSGYDGDQTEDSESPDAIGRAYHIYFRINYLQGMTSSLCTTFDAKVGLSERNLDTSS
jgi:hypothetical protein